MGCGEQCVEICGEQQMQLWCAGNLDSPVQVRNNYRGRGFTSAAKEARSGVGDSNLAVLLYCLLRSNSHNHYSFWPRYGACSPG